VVIQVEGIAWVIRKIFLEITADEAFLGVIDGYHI
jgi:hypothetical protein